MQSSLSSTCVITPDSHTHTYTFSYTYIFTYTHVYIHLFTCPIHTSCHAGWYTCELVSAFTYHFTRFTHLSYQLSYIISDDLYMYIYIEICMIHMYRDIYKIYILSYQLSCIISEDSCIYIFIERWIWLMHMPYQPICRSNRPFTHIPHISRHTIHTSPMTPAHRITYQLSYITNMEWLRLLGSIKLQVFFFAE